MDTAPSFIWGKEGNHPKLKNAATQTTTRCDKVEYMLLEVSWESSPRELSFQRQEKCFAGMDRHLQASEMPREGESLAHPSAIIPAP